MNIEEIINAQPPVKVLRASAGSGKTYRLTYEYVRRVVMNPEAYAHILAVTFTNRATEEMKGRILQSLNTLAQSDSNLQTKYMKALTSDAGMVVGTIRKNAQLALALILHDYNGFAVSTIDSFFQRIARGFFRELELNFGYEVELQGGGYMERAVARLLERSGAEPKLRKLIGNVVSEQLEKNKWDVREDLIKLGGVLMNEGGSFIEELDPARVTVVWNEIEKYIKAGRKEVQEACLKALATLTAAGITPDDVSYKSAGLLVQIATGQAIKEPSPRLRNIAADPANCLVPKKSPHLTAALTHNTTIKLHFNLALDSIDNHLFAENSFSAISKNFARFLLLGELSRELDKLWGEDNRLPIHRTTSLIARIVEQAAVPFIYEKIGTRYDTYMIDEFQDTSQSQWRGFLPLLHEAAAVSERGSAVMLIGDVKQAIYRWRGGDWDTLASGVGIEFGASADQSEQLTQNFRSCEKIVAFNNALTEKIVELEKDSIEAFIGDDPTLVAKYRGGLDTAYADFRQQAAGSNSEGGYVCIDLAENRVATTIAHIQELTAVGYAPGAIAILVRRREEGATMAAALLSAGFNVLSDESLYVNSSTTVRFTAACLGLAVNTEDLISRGIFNHFMGETVTSELGDSTIDFLTGIRLHTPIEAIEAIITHFKLGARDVAYLQAFYQAASNFSNTKTAELGAFTQWWSATGSSSLALSLPDNTDGITILTIHKSKGLQFDAVIVPWATWNFNPKTNSTFIATATKAPFDALGPVIVNFTQLLGNSVFRGDYIRETAFANIDNVNLLYVAVTRAKQALILITEPSEKTKGNTTSALINKACDMICNEIELTATTLPDGTQRYIFGTLTSPHVEKEEEAEVKELIINEMLTRERIDKIATRGLQWRITDDTDQAANPMAARGYGITMHEILRSITTLDEIPAATDRLVASGRITNEQGVEFASDLTQATDNEQVRMWFDSEWEAICERGILLPDGHTRRPDRVLTNGARTLVIDYKFGLQSPKHRIQLSEYITLLEAMGYPAVEGYLWYVADRIIERI